MGWGGQGSRREPSSITHIMAPASLLLQNWCEDQELMRRWRAEAGCRTATGNRPALLLGLRS